MKIVLTPYKLPMREAQRLGGKGKHLLELSLQEYPVPAWFAVSSEVFDRICWHSRGRDFMRAVLKDIDFNSVESVQVAADRLQNFMRSAVVDKRIWREIISTYSRYFSPDECVAVRSSASVEDTEGHSFAGQLESFLFVNGQAGLIEAIRRCWASAFSARVLTYLHLNGLDPADMHLAVIVQHMVPARVSGVMFTADPVMGRKDTLVITANPGLGVAIVSGLVEGDTYRVNKQTMVIEQDISPKKRMVVPNEELRDGTLEVPVPQEQQELPCLTPNEIRELAQTGLGIEELYGRPQDIEWAIDGNRLHILQARPITSFAPLVNAHRIIWDNSNIIESYSGITSPLTFSFAREAYSVVYRQAARLAGISNDVIAANDEMFESMIGLIKGRVYYNLNGWYQILSLLPGFRHNKVFMEQMMGVREAIDWQDRVRHSSRIQRLLELPGLVVIGMRMLYHTLTLERRVTAFQVMVNTVCGEYEHKEPYDLEMTDLVMSYYDLRRRLLWHWQVPIANDFLTALFFGVLRKLITRYRLDESDTLQNDLLCGEGGMLSTELAKSIIRMAATIRENRNLLALVERTSDRDLCQLLLDESEHGALAVQFREYLNRYGYRCVGELKLEEPSLKDDPTPLVASIRSYLPRQELRVEAAQRRELSIRQRAEEHVRLRLRGWRPSFLAPRYLLFRWVLGRARSHVRYRENMRFARTRVFGIVRDLFNAVGKKLHQTGHLDNPRDVFYLEVPDILGFVRGTISNPDLRSLAQSRKQEFQRYYQEEPPPDRFETTGTVWHGNDFLAKALADHGDSSRVLRGHGCCPGIVKGAAKVVSSPRENRPEKGEILVAKETDPGWVTLFPLAAGLLIERGSLLSHSAIVARELGIPTIVGIPGLTQAIRSGQSVEMDGAKGIVTIVSRVGEVNA
ncbi:MAG: PEP/pyruvate-binding domain-containing protein [Desulfatiglandales bacterium]